MARTKLKEEEREKKKQKTEEIQIESSLPIPPSSISSDTSESSNSSHPPPPIENSSTTTTSTTTSDPRYALSIASTQSTTSSSIDFKLYLKYKTKQELFLVADHTPLKLLRQHAAKYFNLDENKLRLIKTGIQLKPIDDTKPINKLGLKDGDKIMLL